MTPTAKLRFVEREVQVHFDETGCQLPDGIVRNKTALILQQWFESFTGLPHAGEWRDVLREREHG